jgi:hypothetical protein
MAERSRTRRDFRARWEVVTTRVFDRWFLGLDPERANQVTAALRRVAKAGPLLGRPRVDSIKGSRVHHLKELRLHDGVRVLFAFDPNRRAIMLVGGDKTGSWNRWYRQHIPVAERLYVDHLRSIGERDRCMSQQEAGLKPAARSR